MPGLRPHSLCAAGDAEIGDLRTATGALDQRLFTYARYNTDLTSRALADLGSPDIRPEDVQLMDSIHHIGDLQRVGMKTAGRVVPEHFAGFLGE